MTVSAEEDPGTAGFYTARVRPVLERSCYSCHGGMNHRGGFNMQSRAGMLKGGHNGAALVPGNPSRSLLILLMRHEGPADDPMPMPPPPRPKVEDKDILAIERWVKAGAVMPVETPKP